MKVLVTGGSGYIGSHCVLAVLEEGHEVTVIDNMFNSSPESLKRIQKLTGKEVTFCEVDCLDVPGLEAVFAATKFDAVIHFAGLKAVGESVAKPLFYYENNVAGTVNLLNVMTKYDVKNIVFSSSATVYGDPATVPVTEDFPTTGTNPYGRTKLFIEEILKDVHRSDSAWNVVLLRYFNPVGAHKSGQIGEDPKGIPNNLMPFIQQVAVGKREALSVFGADYPTKDGTGVRDYIHVVDLAKGHTAALKKLSSNPGCVTYNLGTGVGYSVLEMLSCYEKACGRQLQHKLVERRPGDVAVVYGDASLAQKELGWKAELGLVDMCEDSWRWISNNPNGYN
mmetsp:Transcript_12436/g.25268  ORF Transcript_12436/g.25268 Transcript_12436/m.25268 type:complete len:337 (+) Transcript_12436:79-1089(+)